MRIFGLENTARVGMGYDTVMLAQAANILERRATQTEDGAEIIRTRNGIWYKIVERATSTGGMITMGLDVSADVKYEVELQQQQSKLRKFVVELERSEGHAAELARKLNEEKLRAERSANSKSAFLANMSHELRTPLNAINGFSEILSEEMYGPLGDERYKGYAQDILASGQHLLDMINDILDMAKIEAGKMTVELQPIDLVDPVDAAVRMIRRKAEDKGIKMSLVANEGLPLVDADHRAIRQMILNLVSNAIKFTDEGGEIRVSIDQKGDQLRVAVKDNGIGIPEEALPRLAAPFEQVTETRDRNYEGTGLGLALTKSFAEMHGGKLVIASQEGKGTQVSFFLPISKTNRSQATAAA
jgi:two-component system cell cycle sensor histidine kinase PleC